MLKKGLLIGLAAVGSAKVHFKETFDNTYPQRWVSSGDGAWKHSAGEFYADAEEGKGLQTSQDAKFYHISAHVPEPFTNAGEKFVVSFSVKHEQMLDCGGGYLKLLKPGFSQKTFNGDTEYNIMFGPDICGNTKKIHFIINYKGKNHEVKVSMTPQTDVFTHFYTLIMNPDQTYEVMVDDKTVKSGNLLEDFDFLPPAKINDPEQSKPKGWVENAMMDDPEDVKPEGYDDVLPEIDDPEAVKPDDWDDEDDGEWEAPSIPNPDYQGPWKAKQIPNPDYKGPWIHPQIDNPEYEEDINIYAFDSMAGVGIDLWQVKSGSIFDNIIMADNVEEVAAFREAHTVIDAERKMKDNSKPVPEEEDDEEDAEDEEDEEDEEEDKEDL